MSRIGKYIAIVLIIGLLGSCYTSNAPKAYDMPVKAVQQNPYGCWLSATLISVTDQVYQGVVSGELICLESDTVFILESDYQIISFPVASILSADVYTHQNQSNNYFRNSMLLLIPNALGAIIHITSYAGGFVAFAIPTILVGGLHSLAERSASRHIKNFNQDNNLTDIYLYARFPAGKPTGINLNELTLNKQIY